MMHLTTVVGARPQFIKAAAVSRAVREIFSPEITERIIHTGQHYDHEMSEVFFEELQLPRPEVNLAVGSHSHGKQTALMISLLEKEFLTNPPDAVLVYGDTNSTLAGALAASKLHIPVIHVEAGMRSYDKSMPEEINRVLSDHVSTLLFTPTETGMRNLKKEGLVHHRGAFHDPDHPVIYHCGDVMYDNCLHFQALAEERSRILEEYGLEPGRYHLATLHRAQNTDDPARLTNLFTALLEITHASGKKTIVPLHPRTSSLLRKSVPDPLLKALMAGECILATPVAYFDMLVLEKNAHLILTDSGGVQKEAYFFGKPCIILRAETEWKEITATRSAILADADPKKIRKAYQRFESSPALSFPPIFGDGHAASFICRTMLDCLG
ncbi:MAG: UDP-N-acetylglucosamine 2-epimerase (non-hydrolyzing) [Bacteroidales bacterium]|nr:UDP-N-acetylglucosamine 2-epimerase (non-hydrolyzing) [Bacteroidales bacterium]